MKQLFILLRADMRNLLGWNVLRHGKDPGARKKAYQAILLRVLLAAALLFAVFFYFYPLTQAFAQLGKPELILSLALVGGALVSIFTSFVSAPNMLFTFRDFDALLSMPIPVRTVALSRLLRVYARDFAFMGLFLIVAIVNYALVAEVGALLLVRFLLLALLAPMLPIAVAATAGTLIAKLGAGRRRSNALRILLPLLLTLGAMALSMQMTEIIESVEDVIAPLASRISSSYPPAAWFSAAVLGDYGAFACFAAINALPFALFAWAAAHFLRPMHAALTGAGEPKQRAKAARAAGLRGALLRRELKRYFSCPIYVMNTAIGPLLELCAAIALLIIGKDGLAGMLGLPGAEAPLAVLLPYVAIWMLALGTTTSSSISLEGKALEQLKVLPVAPREVYRAKLLMSLSIGLPLHLISATIFLIALQPTLQEALFLYLLPAAAALFSAVAGLQLNLLFPRFDWKSETEVVKQGLPTLLLMLLSFALAIPPALLTLNGIASPLIVGACFAALCALGAALLWRNLCATWSRRFIELG